MDKTAAGVLRVYEYVTDDGTVFWSLTKLPSTVSLPTRLVLQDRKGIVPGQFLGRIKQEWLAGQQALIEDEVTEEG